VIGELIPVAEATTRPSGLKDNDALDNGEFPGIISLRIPPERGMFCS
jgi:hypothetical protein